MNHLTQLSALLAGTVAGEASGPPLATTLVFTALLVVMIATLALEEKLHAKKSFITGVFAVVCAFLGVWLLGSGEYPGEVAFPVGHETMHMPVFITGVDWSVITIIVGSSVFVDVTSRSGLFTWVAIKLTKASKGDPYRLLWSYGLMTVMFSAVLNNVTAMIIVGSLTGVSLKKLGRAEKMLGFLLVEGLLTNVGGLLTLISSVPNIIVGHAAGISFMRFFLVASPYVALATVGTILLGARLFQISKLTDPEEKATAAELVLGFDENDGVESKGFFTFGAIMSVLFVVTIAATSVIPVLRDLGMGFVAGVFALIMLLRFKNQVDDFYRAIDWDLIGFFCFLFMIINVMEHAKVLELIGHGLEHVIALGPRTGAAALLGASAVVSSVTDNIPLSAMLAKILVTLHTPPDSRLWWSVVFGANLGGNLTPIGSASTLVAVTIIHKNNLHLTFAGFVKVAVPYAVLQLLLAVVYVLVFL